MRRGQYTLVVFIIAGIVLLSLSGIIINDIKAKGVQIEKTQVLLKLGDAVRQAKAIQKDERQVGIDFTGVHLGSLGGWPAGESFCGSSINDSSDWLFKSIPYWYSDPATAVYYNYTADVSCDSLVSNCVNDCSDNVCVQGCYSKSFDCIYAAPSDGSYVVFSFSNVRSGLYELYVGSSLINPDFLLDGKLITSPDFNNAYFIESGSHQLLFSSNLCDYTLDCDSLIVSNPSNPNSLTLKRVIPSNTCVSGVCSVTGDSCTIDDDCSLSKYVNCVPNETFIKHMYNLFLNKYFKFMSSLATEYIESIINNNDANLFSKNFGLIEYDAVVEKIGTNSLFVTFYPLNVPLWNVRYTGLSNASYQGSTIVFDAFRSNFASFQNDARDLINNGLLDELINSILKKHSSFNIFASVPVRGSSYSAYEDFMNSYYSAGWSVSNPSQAINNLEFDNFFSGHQIKPNCLYYLREACQFLSDEVPKGIRETPYAQSTALFDEFTSHQVIPSNWGIAINSCQECHDVGEFSNPCLNLTYQPCLDCFEKLTGFTYDNAHSVTFNTVTNSLNPFNGVDDCANLISIEIKPLLNDYLIYRFSDLQSLLSERYGFAWKLDAQKLNVTKINFYGLDAGGSSFNSTCLDSASAIPQYNCRFLKSDIKLSDVNLTALIPVTFNCSALDYGPDGCPFNIVDNCVNPIGDYCLIQSDSGGFLQLPYSDIDINVSANVLNAGNTNELVKLTLLIDAYGNLLDRDFKYFRPDGLFNSLPSDLIVSNSKSEDGFKDVDGHYDFKSINIFGRMNPNSFLFNDSVTFNPHDYSLDYGAHMIRSCVQTDFNDEWNWSNNCADLVFGGCFDGSEDVAQSCCEGSGYEWLDSPYYGACCGDDSGVCTGMIFQENFDDYEVSPNEQFEGSLNDGFSCRCSPTSISYPSINYPFCPYDTNGLIHFSTVNVDFSNPYDVDYGDVDGDGDNDLLIVNRSEISWFENDGLGNFNVKHLISSSGGVKALVVDINNDNNLDVVIISDKHLSYWLNNGGGVFSDKVTLSGYLGNIFSMTSEDIDGDGYNDIILSNCYDVFYINPLTNEVHHIYYYPSGNYPNYYGIDYSNIAVGDLDDDGDLDIALEYSYYGTHILILNNEMNSFEPISLYDSTTWSLPNLRLGDVDADGDLDIVAFINYNLYWFENDASWSNHLITSSYSGSFALTDVDGDGFIDVIINDGVLFNDGNGVFNFKQASIGDYILIPSFIDDDSDIDLIVMDHYNIKVLLSHLSDTSYSYCSINNYFNSTILGYNAVSCADGCIFKPEGSLPAGYSIMFYGKGKVSAQIYDYTQVIISSCWSSDGSSCDAGCNKAVVNSVNGYTGGCSSTNRCNNPITVYTFSGSCSDSGNCYKPINSVNIDTSCSKGSSCASCEGTPTSCSDRSISNCDDGCSIVCSGSPDGYSMTESECDSCGWTWVPEADGSGGDDGSCPLIDVWNGSSWVREHEGFPQALLSAVEMNSYDSLPNAKCVNGSLKVRIVEELNETTHLTDFKLFKTNKVNGLLKPDIYGKPRVIINLKQPVNCSVSDYHLINNCLNLISKKDGFYLSPVFNESLTDDWVIVNFTNISSINPKLYLVAVSNPGLSAYNKYLTDSLGRDSFNVFDSFINNSFLRPLINDFWNESVKLQVELLVNGEWVNQGRVSTGSQLKSIGSDDFLISINNSLNKSNLSIRLRFITGTRSIDYVALDDSIDPEIIVTELIPESILFNNQSINNFSHDMILGDVININYSCSSNEDYFISIKGYYEYNHYLPERKRDLISSLFDYFMLFFGGKPYAVKTAAQKGFFKGFYNKSLLSDSELIAQQRPFGLVLLIGNLLILITILMARYQLKALKSKRKSKRLKTLILVMRLIIITSLVLFVFINGLAFAGYCETGSCSSLSTSTCNSCSECSSSCSGTPTSCVIRSYSDCDDGCSWISKYNYVVSNPINAYRDYKTCTLLQTMARKGRVSTIEDLNTGCVYDGYDIYNGCNGGEPYDDWHLFKLTTKEPKGSGSGGLYFYENNVNSAVYDYITEGPILVPKRFVSNDYWTNSIVSSDSGASSLLLTDVDGDGDEDVISVDYSNDRLVWFENGASWTEHQIADFVKPSKGILGDVDGDGDEDVIVFSYLTKKASWFENGNYWTEHYFNSLESPIDLTVGDINGDEKDDVLFLNIDSIVIYLSDSKDAIQLSRLLRYASAIKVGDIDSDGDNDIIITDIVEDKIYLLKNEGIPWSELRINQINQFISWSDPTNIALDDVDGDGDLDIIANSYSTNRLVWFENGASWTEHLISDGISFTRITDADINGDGYNDIISCLSTKIVYLPNNGAGSFSKEQLISPLSNPLSIALGDIDGDSKLNVLSSSQFDKTINLLTLVNQSLNDKNNVMYFNGFNNYLSYTISDSLIDKSFTVSLWFKYKSQGASGKVYWTLFNKNPTGQGYNDFAHIWINSQTLKVQARVGNGVTSHTLSSNNNINDNQWHLVTLTYDDSLKKYSLYLDGVIASSITENNNWVPAFNTANITIGVWPAYHDYFNGFIDDVRVYGESLTNDVVRDLYLSTIDDDFCSTADNFIANDNQVCFNGKTYSCSDYNNLYLKLKPLDQIRNTDYSGPLNDYFCSIR